MKFTRCRQKMRTTWGLRLRNWDLGSRRRGKVELRAESVGFRVAGRKGEKDVIVRPSGSAFHALLQVAGL